MAMAQSTQGDYFSSYCDLSVHELMLKDRPRMLAYRSFFEEHRDLVRDKIVMDVGAGTGILSLFAAVAGAKKVFAVEASDVSALCQEIVEENKLEGVVDVLHGTVEDISLPEGYRQVDIIMSEWMGFYLLHESMLDSVIVARDRFLGPGGILAPSHACLYFAPVDMSCHFQNRAEEWSNIYGFDFSPVASRLNMEEVAKPLIKVLSPDVLRAQPQIVLSLNLKTVTVAEIERFSALLNFPVEQDSKIFGFAAWFDVHFQVDSGTLISTTDAVGPATEGSSVKSGTVVNEKGDAEYTSIRIGHASPHSSDVVASAGSPSQITASPSVSSGDLLQVPGSPNVSRGDLSQERSGAGSENGTASPARSGSSEVAGTDGSRRVVSLKTGPGDPPTHWKQTVIFLPRTIMVESGVTLGCRVRMSQDTTNKRLYNITVALVDDEEEEEEGAAAAGEIEEEDYDLEGSDDESDASIDHPVPCECGSGRCRLVAALVDKYNGEEDYNGEEAEMLEVEPEVKQ